MTRFTEEDRERIRSQLVDAGRELFAQYGFAETRIRDVTDAAGIGTSTFYQFFESKESLYVEVLHVERRRLHDRIDAAVSEAETPRDEVETMLRVMLREVRSNPHTSRLFVEGELRLVAERLSDAERQSLAAGEETDDLPYAESWAAMDAFRYDDPAAIADLFRSLVFVTRAKDTDIVPSESYEETEERLVETIVDGLFLESR
jgi:AcrR family transcriptional regulator